MSYTCIHKIDLVTISNHCRAQNICIHLYSLVGSSLRLSNTHTHSHTWAHYYIVRLILWSRGIEGHWDIQNKRSMWWGEYEWKVIILLCNSPVKYETRLSSLIKRKLIDILLFCCSFDFGFFFCNVPKFFFSLFHGNPNLCELRDQVGFSFTCKNSHRNEDYAIKSKKKILSTLHARDLEPVL